MKNDGEARPRSFSFHRRPAKRRGATPLRVRRGFLRRRPPETHADQN